MTIPAEAIAAVLVGDPTREAAARIQRLGHTVPDAVRDRAVGVRDHLAELGRLTDGPADPGLVYEGLLDDDARRAGAHFTPPEVARGLADAALDGIDAEPDGLRVWDPACGGAVLLLAAADHLVARGADPARLLRCSLHGTDIDPGALFVSAAVLHRWGRHHGVDVEPGGLRCGDALLEPAAAPDTPVDLVIGNPPFQSQLRGGNVRSAETLAALRSRFGDLTGPYTDTAALFLARAIEQLDAGGRCGLIQPLSVLGNRDTASVRSHLDERAELVGLWVATEAVFDAAVEVCAPILQHRGPPGTEPADRLEPTTTLWRGRTVQRLPNDAGAAGEAERDGGREPISTTVRRTGGTWSAATLPILGVPDPHHRSDGTLGRLVRATAGFRDEYYGLIPHVRELPPQPDGVPIAADDLPIDLAPLVTVGLVDPGHSHWGDRPVTFARQRYDRPVVDLTSLRTAESRAAMWIARTLVPKVVVATQTRVGEAAADHRGRWAVSTPAIALLAEPEHLDEIAAVVCSPIGSIAAIARTAGTGRTATTIRHSTKSITSLPLPIDHDAWATGGRALRDGDRIGFVDAMAHAYDVPAADRGPLAEWWLTAAPAP